MVECVLTSRMMAKNIYQKKKRIAHYKNAFEENDFMSCSDYVSSIIEDMDNFACLSNLPRMQQNDEPKVSLPSTSKTELQNSAIVKSKKFCLNKKFPLMEKTQKTLKQLRHNRRVPKPRAHLSMMSPLKKCIINNLGKATEKLKKSKEKINLKNTLKSQNKSELKKPIQNAKTQCSNDELRPCTSKSVKEVIKEPCKKKGSNIVKRKCNVGDSSSSKDTSKATDNSSDSEYEIFIKKAKKDLKKHKMRKTLISKKKIPKKSTKKITKKNNSLKAAKFVPDSDKIMEYDSGVSDVASVSSLSRSNKKGKACQNMHNEVAVDCNNESDFSDTNSTPSLPYYRRSKGKNCQRYAENEMCIASDFNDAASTSSLPYYRRSKGVGNAKENLGNEICNAAVHNDSDCEVEFYQGESYTRDSSSENDDENNMHDKLCIESMKIDSNLLSKKSSLPGNNNASSSSNVCLEYRPFDICENDKNCSLNSSEQSNQLHPDSYVVDLTESDNECENDAISAILSKDKDNKTVASLNEMVQYSEESDLEIIDVVVAPTVKLRCDTEGQSCESRLGLKIEKVDCFVKTETQGFNQPVERCKTSEKMEARYVANICTRNDKNITSLPSQLHTGENINGSVQSKEIKKETCDDIIIIDIAGPNHQLLQNEMSNISCNPNLTNKDQVKMADIPVDVKQSLTKLPDTTFNNSCKQLPINIGSDINGKTSEMYTAICRNTIAPKENRTLAAEKELKLYEIACSNFKMPNKTPTEAVYIQDKEINSLGPVDPKVLIQTLKKELESYERILQTEKSVGVAFKLLESQQAEKLVSLKSMISACLKNSAANCNNSKIIKSEMNSMLSSPDLNTSKNFTVSGHLSSITSTEVISRDFKNISPPEPQTSFSNINLVPLSSIPENDIKPNISKLEQRLHSTQKSIPYEKTALTFGEECTVCGKGALAACQQCAKVFFCSNECGKKYWDGGHRNECRK